MSGFGVDQQSKNLYTVDFTTGIWAAGPAIGLPPPDSPYTEIYAMVYDCDESQMYLMTDNAGVPGVFTLWELNTAGGGLVFIANNNTVGTPFGLAYDSANQVTYGVRSGSAFTYTVDLSNNTWTALPMSSGTIPRALVYDCPRDIMYGLAINTNTNVFEMHTVNRSTGVWMLIGATGVAEPHLGMVYDQSTDKFYGTVRSLLFVGQMYEINVGTGQWTPILPNPTGTQEPVAMAFERPCCCVHEDTLVTLANHTQVPICSIKAGDLVLDHRNQPVKVVNNVCCGKQGQFVCLPASILNCVADLLICSGHPLLLNGQEVECQHIGGGNETALECKIRVFTLVTERKTFVNMNQGAYVGTWSEAALENFIENDAFGKQLRLKNN